jgi:hypothetical protein
LKNLILKYCVLSLSVYVLACGQATESKTDGDSADNGDTAASADGDGDTTATDGDDTTDTGGDTADTGDTGGDSVDGTGATNDGNGTGGDTSSTTTDGTDTTGDTTGGPGDGGTTGGGLKPCETDSDCDEPGMCPPAASLGCACASPKPDKQLCIPKCETAEDCLAKDKVMQCLDGVCAPEGAGGGSTDGGTPPPKKCESDDDCGPKAQCNEDGVCEPMSGGTDGGTPQPKKCESNKDCADNCPSANGCTCNPDGLCVAIKEPGGGKISCENDDDCAELCPEFAKLGCGCKEKVGKCAPICESDEDCPKLAGKTFSCDMKEKLCKPEPSSSGGPVPLP